MNENTDTLDTDIGENTGPGETFKAEGADQADGSAIAGNAAATDGITEAGSAIFAGGSDVADASRAAWDRQDELHVGPRIKKISDMLARDGNRDLKHSELTFSQLILLDIICTSPERSLSQKQLAERLEVSHPTVVGLVKRMEEKGLVTTHVSARDGRIRLVEPTDRGIQAWRISVDNRRKTESVMLAGLTLSQVANLCASLDTMLSNLRDAESNLTEGQAIANCAASGVSDDLSSDSPNASENEEGLA